MLSDLKRHLLFLLSLLLFVNVIVYGIDTNIATTNLTLRIPEVALIRTNTSIITLTLQQREAGMSIETSKSDSTSRLLITSIISSTQRTLSAKISSGTVPDGTHLELSAQRPNGNFVGTTGSYTSNTALDYTDRPIVTNVGTCYSGTGADDGFVLKYTFALNANTSSYGSLRATTGTQVIVTLTLTAAQ